MKDSASSLNISNPDHITYQYEMISIEIMGGVRTDILDRMKVTLKVTHLRPLQ